MRISLSTDASQRRKILFGIGVVGVLAVTGSLYAISRSPDSKTSESIVYELAPADVVTVRSRPLTRTLRLSGSLTPLRHAVVKSRSSGTLVDLSVKEGDRVRTGALLARIDPRNLQAELDARTAALRKAQADLVLATKNRDNSVVLLKQRLISQNAFDQTEATYMASIANEEAAQAQVRMSQIALADTEIRADFNGVVATRSVQVGERVMPDMPLLSIVDLSQMQLEALVPVADVPTIEVGQAAHFTVDGFGDREFTGQVERISPQAQPGTRSLTIYVTVTNTDGTLKGGMFADGELLIEQTQPLVAVPSSAIRSDNEGHYVFALEAGVVTRTPVVVGATFEAAGLTVIESGLTETVQVIVANAATIKHGIKAKLST
jgi:RND family efflux transporter MFP subunit